MDYIEEDDRILVRLDPGDYVLESLETVREECEVTGGFFAGIGAVDEVTLGQYDVGTEDYKEETKTGQFEVTSFLGNIGPDKIHAHIQVASRDYTTLGGHCSGAKVSGTFEIEITTGETVLTHHLDERTGLHVFDL